MKLFTACFSETIFSGAVAFVVASAAMLATVEPKADEPVPPARDGVAVVGPGQAVLGGSPSEAPASARDQAGVAPEKGVDAKAGVPTPGSGIAREIAAGDFRPQDRELAHRAEARWRSQIEGNFEAAYGYTLPSYRQTHTVQQYRGLFGSVVRWRLATVQGIRYDTPSVAHVRLNLETEHVPPWGGQAERLVTRLYETWLYRGGAWWLSVEM
jgi:hypothetical protein